jgi:hypothetical protein
VAGRNDGLKTGPTKTVHGLSGHFDRQSGEEAGHTGDIPVVFSCLVRCARDHVLNPVRWNPRPVHESSNRDGQEVVRPNAGQGTSVPAHRRPHGANDDGVAIVHLRLTHTDFVCV